MTDPFDPRQATLAHAARADARARDDRDALLAESVNSIACGLVYVGDQLRELVGAVKFEVRTEQEHEDGGESNAG